MTFHFRAAAVSTAAAAIVLALPLAAQQRPAGPRWLKANLHAHTINSDGDSPAVDVFAWYRRHRYQVLAITDHNMITDVGAIGPALGFQLISGEEITNEKNVHVNGLGVHKKIDPATGTITEILQTCIDRVRAEGGIPLINHPNWKFTISVKDMLPLKNAGLLEIASGYALMNHDGDGREVPSTEQMWDQLLTGGQRMWAVAVDDTHNLTQEFLANRGNPGQGWVYIRSAALSEPAILDALNRGDFYASTGVELTELTATPQSLTVGWTEDPDQRRHAVFVGRGGKELARVYENPARYTFKGDEGYVRARIDDSGGWHAWTQPVFMDK